MYLSDEFLEFLVTRHQLLVETLAPSLFLTILEVEFEEWQVLLEHLLDLEDVLISLGVRVLWFCIVELLEGTEHLQVQVVDGLEDFPKQLLLQLPILLITEYALHLGLNDLHHVLEVSDVAYLSLN